MSTYWRGDARMSANERERIEQLGAQAANDEIDSGGPEIVCPYKPLEDPYADSPYRAWMHGYWGVMGPALGDGS